MGHDTLGRMEKESQSLLTIKASLQNPNIAQTLEQIPPDGRSISQTLPTFQTFPIYSDLEK